ncbi:class I lanthipeptide [uncultured Alistipes sp.]|uniref:class I lanthipeptide n=1 Tax=uncultured Alistipes sp. TaxID=538949 RepID=UPI0026704169|nr:class I lanthipeptide [uncultured Alistipes sp.]
MKKLQLKRDVVATLEKASMQNVKGGINVSDNSICVSVAANKTCHQSENSPEGVCIGNTVNSCTQTHGDLCKTMVCQTNEAIYCEIGRITDCCIH